MHVKARSPPTGDFASFFASDAPLPAINLEVWAEETCPTLFSSHAPETSSLDIAHVVLAQLRLPPDDALAAAMVEGCDIDTLAFFTRHHAPKRSAVATVVLESEAKPVRQRPATAATLRGARMSGTGGGRKRPGSAK